MATVFVGMSGGVDSSVTAHLLLQQGYTVVGVFMKNWSGRLDTKRGTFSFPCSSQSDFESARQAAGHLGIPLYTFDFEQEYRDRVIEYFVGEIERGRTPNPDIMCNKEIKFKVFLDKCVTLGADMIATGHYARVSEEDGLFLLKKGLDETKDQSYFLATLGQEQLSKTLFPIGELQKSEVRRIAQEIELPNADRPDSQGICFVGEIDVNEFIKAFVGEKPGKIVTSEGEVIGEHKGIYFHTIGQRKGLGIGGGLPYFVVEKRLETNELVVAKGINPLDLYQKSVVVDQLSWSGTPLDLPADVSAKVRYRSADVPVHAEAGATEGSLQVTFDEPQRAIAEGQFMVFYEGDILRGSGVMNVSHE